MNCTKHVENAVVSGTDTTAQSSVAGYEVVALGFLFQSMFSLYLSCVVRPCYTCVRYINYD